MKKYRIDKKMLTITLILVVVGLVGFISASLGTYIKSPQMFHAMLIRHVGLGVLGGLFFMYIFSNVDYRYWKKHAPLVYIAGILISLLSFVPGLAMPHGGAYRWVSLGFISFQTAEFLKFGVILFVSYWMARYLSQIREYRWGIFALIGILAIPLGVLVFQRDTSSLVLIGLVSFVIYFLRGAPLKHVGVLILLGLVFLGGLVVYRPYILERVQSFYSDTPDRTGRDYQIIQAKIAIGSGGVSGRGLGQSVQKFGVYLPESNSDSIFAVFAEETGFVGAVFLTLLYLLFLFFGLSIARKTKDAFGQNLATGIVLLISIQAFLNIMAITRLIPLSGMPLIFMSNGGTSLLVSLTEIGILLNISRFINKKQIRK